METNHEATHTDAMGLNTPIPTRQKEGEIQNKPGSKGETTGNVVPDDIFVSLISLWCFTRSGGLTSLALLALLAFTVSARLLSRVS